LKSQDQFIILFSTRQLFFNFFDSFTFCMGWELGRDGPSFEGTLRLKMSELAQENTDATMPEWGLYLGPIYQNMNRCNIRHASSEGAEKGGSGTALKT
jgi:hypothetical protein